MSGGTSESLASPGSWSPYQSHRAEMPNVWSRRVHKRGPRAEMAEIRALSRGAGQRAVQWEGRGQQLGLGGQTAARRSVVSLPGREAPGDVSAPGRTLEARISEQVRWR